MDLSIYKLKSLTDPAWIELSIKQMGESKFWSFKNRVYDLLDLLKVGESMKIDPNWNKSNIEFYIKIAEYYISESNVCYRFNSTYTAINRQFDNEKITASLNLLKKNRINNETLVESSN